MRVSTHRPTTRLFVREKRTPGQTLLARIALMFALIAMVLAILWLDRDGLHDNSDGEMSFTDVVYFTAVTVTTVGYGDIVPITLRARVIDALLVTPIRLVIWLIFLGTAYELVLQRWLETRRMSKLQRTLSGHLIICGYGHAGESAATEAVARGTLPEAIVVIDRDAERLAQAAKLGYTGLRGDTTREEDLRDAGIAAAQTVLVCLPRDDAAVLTVLTIRQLNKIVRVICSVDEQENIKLIRQAGADALIAPSIVSGRLMADSMKSSHITDYIDDLMRADGRIRLIERTPRREEIGQPMRTLGPGLVVRLIRGEEHIGFWEGERAVVVAGDRLLEIEPVEGT